MAANSAWVPKSASQQAASTPAAQSVLSNLLLTNTLFAALDRQEHKRR
jgi:hypothetical protein